MVDLFWEIDKLGDPSDAEMYLIRPDDGWSHATIESEYLGTESREIVQIKDGSRAVDALEGKRKRLRWPKNIHREAYRSADFDYRPDVAEEKKQRVQISQKMSAELIKDFPAEPVETYTVEEIRKMPPFCGVYFAFNDDGSCHYVGESRNVPSRVSSSREEIGQRRIGIIHCEPHERKRIENYFVAMLDPPGNACSSHRMINEDLRRSEKIC
jgi:hypothetical protein